MPTRYLFDIEADELYEKVTKVHCIGLYDIEADTQLSFGPDRITEALDLMYLADELCGHNIIRYDLPTLLKVMEWRPRGGCRIRDTLVMARAIHSDIKKEDLKYRPDMPQELKGKHSLKAWGVRIGEHKAEYTGGFSEWSIEMQDYMDQDVVTNVALLRHLKPHEYPQGPLDLEHRAEEICTEMWLNGWYFDKQAAIELHIKLAERRDYLVRELVKIYPPWQKLDRVLIPKRDDVKRGYTKGVPVEKYKTVVFNPGSRQHIELKLREAGWVPEEFTPSGAAQLDEAILDAIDVAEYPSAQLLIEYLLVQKRIGQIAEGDQAWLKKVTVDGKVHTTTNPCGTVTSRAAHYDFNISQVPSVAKPYGPECRALFGVPKGWKLVGADQAGLELRTFAHYLAYFDGGSYAKVVVDGDPHWFHCQALGLVPQGLIYDEHNPEHKTPRNKYAKRWIYAWLYGAGPPKLAVILKSTVRDARNRSETFLKRIPAIKRLRERVAQECQKGWLRGMDGRHVPVRSEHAALNSLLQSAGAIVCKRWLVDAYDALVAKGYTCGYYGDFVFVGYIHDELQVACRGEIAEDVGRILVETARAAGKSYGLKVPLDSSFTIGNNWADTH